jgi:hypothetical protein
LEHIAQKHIKMPTIRPKVLNDVFQAAADQARQKLPTLTHNQQVRNSQWNHHRRSDSSQRFYCALTRDFSLVLFKVARLYRNGLKVLSSWAIDRDIFIDEATKMRAKFDAERGCNQGKALRLLRVSNYDA